VGRKMVAKLVTEKGSRKWQQEIAAENGDKKAAELCRTK